MDELVVQPGAVNWFSGNTDACNSGASSDHREPISLHQAVYEYIPLHDSSLLIKQLCTTVVPGQQQQTKQNRKACNLTQTKATLVHTRDCLSCENDVQKQMKCVVKKKKIQNCLIGITPGVFLLFVLYMLLPCDGI